MGVRAERRVAATCARVIVLAATFWAATAIAGEADALVGVWRYEREVDTREGGQVVQVPGPRYHGLLVYTADGHVSVTLMPQARHWRVDEATADELRQSVGGASTAYAGRFEVDASSQTVMHRPEVALDPADEGKALVRRYVVSGDSLQLSGEFMQDGEQLRFTVYWARVK